MQEANPEPPPSTDYGDLIDIDLDEVEKYLEIFTDQDALFDLAIQTSEEDLVASRDISTPGPEEPPQRHKGSRTNRPKRGRDSTCDRHVDENAPSRSKRQWRPVDAAVVPVLTVPSLQSSQSDAGSKASSPLEAQTPLPDATSSGTLCHSELLPSKKSQLLQNRPATVSNISQCVQDYIQQEKAQMKKACEAALSLTHYVDARLVRRKILKKELVVLGDRERRTASLEWRQIFEDSAEAKPKRSVLLLGNAGMGKTTLIQKLGLEWSNGSLPQFDFVFLLDGKALTLIEPTFSLQTLLFNLFPSGFSGSDNEPVFSRVLAAPERVLVVFDGFEELRDLELLLTTLEKDTMTVLQKDSRKQAYTVRQLYSAILQRVLLRGCTLLMSARPRGAVIQLLRRVDSLLELCCFTSVDIESYVSCYFAEPACRASALMLLENNPYLLSLSCNPGLCQMVCSVLEHSEATDVLPTTLTGLCHRVLRHKLERGSMNIFSSNKPHILAQVKLPGSHDTQASIGKRMRTRLFTRSLNVKAGVAEGKLKGKEKKSTMWGGAGENGKGCGGEDRIEERNLLSQLSSLAYDGVRGHSSLVLPARGIAARVREVGLQAGLFHSLCVMVKQPVSATGKEYPQDDDDIVEKHIQSWANPFLQSFLAGLHLSLSRTKTFPLQPAPGKGRRRAQREEHDLTQRFAVGLLFHEHVEQRQCHPLRGLCAISRATVIAKQAAVVKHLGGLGPSNLSPAHLLEACHYFYEAVGGRRGSMQWASLLTKIIPEELSFQGVELSMADVFVVGKVLELLGMEGRGFCLGLECTGVQISGLRTLVGLSNIVTYRACIADVIALWEGQGSEGEELVLKEAVSRFQLNPLKATRVCHVEDLAHLVNIHAHRRLMHSSSHSDSILAEGVPAVRELRKLEFVFGQEDGCVALPKLCELLPGLCNLQHLDLETSRIGDGGVAALAQALVSLSSLEILNLSQNCIGDRGVEELIPVLKVLASLRCLSLYSNVISDVGAERLATVLPQMSSLTDLDVKYNKLTDVGAQSLGSSLKNCASMKSLRMWNQCIPCGVFERLQHQDNRILWH